MRRGSSWRALVLLVWTAAACGSRSGLEDWLADGSFEPGDDGASVGAGGGLASGSVTSGGARHAGGSHANGGAGPGGTTAASGGAPATGGALTTGGANSTGGAPSGGRGALLDDPLTIGDERAGWVQCWGEAPGVSAKCQFPEGCRPGFGDPGVCELDGGAKPDPFAICDGEEDCPTGELCCRSASGQGAFCGGTCPRGIIVHLACGSPSLVCGDYDADGIPNDLDVCIVIGSEDGRGPFPADGCQDTDADGVDNFSDQCPVDLESGLPPKPKDGCP
jgi:hypothetical protein